MHELDLTCLQAVNRVMQKRKSGRILNMISGLAFPRALILSSRVLVKNIYSAVCVFLLPIPYVVYFALWWRKDAYKKRSLAQLIFLTNIIF